MPVALAPTSFRDVDSALRPAVGSGAATLTRRNALPKAGAGTAHAASPLISHAGEEMSTKGRGTQRDRA
jgi:hypothetical protein